MKSLFILGRNIELSKAEVFSHFEKEGNKITESSLIENGLLIDSKNLLNNNIVDNFGGIISIGEVLASGSFKEVSDKIESLNLYMGAENKLNYAIWDFSPSYDLIAETLKEKFRREKLKATLKHLAGNIKLQGGGRMKIPSSKLIGEEFFVYDYKDKILFGRIVENCDYEKIEKRDMNKPVRRESLAISPRLAKILINLSCVKKGETLLDPFCGVGTVLSEALLQKVKVIGIDRDKNAINNAQKNMEWFRFNKNDYDLINADSSNETIKGADAIATEPDLGETLKKTPQKKEAKKTLERFENLIIRVINNFKNELSGRIVFTSPYIRVGKKRSKCDIEKILKATGYHAIYEIPEFRENQIVGRMIYVLEK
ncbi:methyltransferase domain-containing protein [Candidatus Pacearchaeota archaeon]|nr:methyltransferase domain-containing protein [Candidatus Pacearchaeota archaeon]